MKPNFCPKCHKRTKTPDFMEKMNVQGTINLACPCGGQVSIKGEKKDEEKETKI